MDTGILARIVLGGWINPTTAAVVGDLPYIRGILELQLKPYACINYTHTGIVITDPDNPCDYESYESLNNTVIDIGDSNNWTVTKEKISLKTGTTCYNQATYFDLAFFPRINFATPEIIEKAINDTLQIYENEFFH